MLHHLHQSSETQLQYKRYIAADDLLLDSFRLAAEIFESGFRPDFLIGLWRGGSAVGIAVQEGLDYFGVETDHIAVRTSYDGPDSYSKRLQGKVHIGVHGLRYLLDRVDAKHSMLIVDDVCSTGNSVQAVIDKLARKSRKNLPQDIRIASVWYRPSVNTTLAPDFYVHKTDDWLVLPYEISGLSREEIETNKPELAAILADLGTSPNL